MIASGGLSGGISSSIAGGSFWKGVREGIITSGLNHVVHHLALSSKGEYSSLKDYEEKITKRINERINKLDDEITGLKTKIAYRESQGKDVVILNRDLGNKESLVRILHEGCVSLNFLLDSSHGHDIKIKYGTKTFNNDFYTKGRVEWGNNNCSLVIYHNNDIDTIIHEMIHVNDVVNRPDMFAPFSANTVLGAISYRSEINAWRMTYALGNILTGVSHWSEINVDFLKRQGY